MNPDFDNKRIYAGKPANVGRFGFLKPGDVIELTLKELECVQDDPDFQPYDPAKVPAPTEEVDPAEASRLAVIEKENGKTRSVGIREMNREELLEHCRAIKGIDPAFKFDERSEAEELIAAILQRDGQLERNTEGAPKDEADLIADAQEKVAANIADQLPPTEPVTPPAPPAPVAKKKAAPKKAAPVDETND